MFSGNKANPPPPRPPPCSSGRSRVAAQRHDNHVGGVCVGAKFEVVSTEMGEIERAQYEAAARMWSEIHREFIYAAQLVEKEGLKPHRRLQVSWRVFWATHQRFFRHMCMAAKVGFV